MIVTSIAILSILRVQAYRPPVPWRDAMVSLPEVTRMPIFRKLIASFKKRGGADATAKSSAVAVRDEKLRRDAVNGPPAGQLTYNPTDVDSPEKLQRGYRRMLVEQMACKDLARRGEYRTAVGRLEADVVAEPSEIYALPLLDLELGRGEFQQAFAVAAAFIDAGGESEGLLLRGFYAAARVGKVFEGEPACLADLLASNDPDTERLLAHAENPGSAAAICAQAVGCMLCRPESYSDAVPYLETALKLDSGNAQTSLYLADAYVGESYAYSKAVRTLESSLSRVDLGSIRILMDLSLKRYRRLLQEFGDGKPWDNPKPGSVPLPGGHPPP